MRALLSIACHTRAGCMCTLLSIACHTRVGCMRTLLSTACHTCAHCSAPHATFQRILRQAAWHAEEFVLYLHYHEGYLWDLTSLDVGSKDVSPVGNTHSGVRASPGLGAPGTGNQAPRRRGGNHSPPPPSHPQIWGDIEGLNTKSDCNYSLECLFKKIMET